MSDKGAWLYIDGVRVHTSWIDTEFEEADQEEE